MPTKKKAARAAAPKPRKVAPKKASPVPARGQFVWYELMTTDPGAAKRFYSQVVGWGTTAFEHDPSYHTWTRKGAPVGGLMAIPDEAKRHGTPPQWMGYVSTPNVDATARQVAQLGGKVLKGPEDIPHVGRFAVIQDPQGAVLAVFKPGPAPTSPPKLDEFSWHELATTDQVAAFRFYSALFGWVQTDAMDMGPDGLYQMYGLDKESMLGGMYNKSAKMPGPPPPGWLYYILVDSVDRAAERVKAAGGKVVGEPMDIPGGRIAVCADPQGAAFAVHSKTR